jgi:serine/threonine protein kinase
MCLNCSCDYTISIAQINHHWDCGFNKLKQTCSFCFSVEISKGSKQGLSTPDLTQMEGETHIQSKKIERRWSVNVGWRFGCIAPREENSVTVKLEGLPAKRFSYSELRAATKAFSEKSKIGVGSFGTVYRGQLSSGMPVAVRKMKMTGTQGESKMYITELSILSQIRHKDVLQLLGWGEDLCKKEYFLVYEFMRSGSLEDVLFDQAEEPLSYGNLADVLHQLDQSDISCLSCQQRFNVVKSIATALDYMHQGRKQKVIHRNIKARHVLLDEKGNVKLGGFGHAILVDQHGEVGFEENIKGTLGYISPEYQLEGILTDKMDVYSFGVLVLQVVCGRQAYSRDLPRGEAYVTDWVRNNLSQGRNLRDIIDKRLGEYDNQSMEVLLTVGLLCSQMDYLARPSMGDVLQMLAGDVPVPAIWESKLKVNFLFISREPTLSSFAGPDLDEDSVPELTR